MAKPEQAPPGISQKDFILVHGGRPDHKKLLKVLIVEPELPQDPPTPNQVESLRQQIAETGSNPNSFSTVRPGNKRRRH